MVVVVVYNGYSVGFGFGFLIVNALANASEEVNLIGFSFVLTSINPLRLGLVKPHLI